MLREAMAGYHIEESDSAVSIEVIADADQQAQLMAAFTECQAGQCSCPTDEYGKLAAMDVERGDDLIRLRLETKPGEKLDTSEIAACLDYTAGLTESGKRT